MRYSDTDRVFDALLLRRLQAGDRRAGERLAARWYPRLLRTAYRLLRDRDQAESAVQEAWSGICRGWFGLKDPARFPAWAYRILHNKCTDRIRHNIRHRSQNMEWGEDEAVIQPRGEDKVSLDQAFAQLGTDHRVAAILYFQEGLTMREIAKVTSTAVGTTKSRLFYARRQLQTALDNHTEGEKHEHV
ncbi:MAG: RNA polymerase sigma factor [Parasphingorhabdus sp.]|uniref:RNA polymerase sigma factor n=1 Tax=Parasphingorhabdus sp. TaxID=2709688 RepID=UPI0032978701